MAIWAEKTGDTNHSKTNAISILTEHGISIFDYLRRHKLNHMKKIFWMAAIVITMFSCNEAPKAPTAEVAKSFYGEQFDPANAIPVSQLMTDMQGKDSLMTKFSGKITQTCTKAGCWMDVETANGETMTVFMKDHNFAVPLSGCEGLTAVMNGKAYYDTLSVEYLRHLAEEAGKPQEEIEKINEPKYVLAFDASGVMIEGYTQAPAQHEHNEEEHTEHGEEAK